MAAPLTDPTGEELAAMSVDVLRGPAVRSISGYRVQAAGHDWDAVRAEAALGRAALTILGDRSGAVLEDPREPAFYWFVRARATAGWDVPGTRPLGLHQHLVVPDEGRTRGPGPRWLIPRNNGTLLTDASALSAALMTASANSHAARTAHR